MIMYMESAYNHPVLTYSYVQQASRATSFRFTAVEQKEYGKCDQYDFLLM